MPRSILTSFALTALFIIPLGLATSVARVAEARGGAKTKAKRVPLRAADDRKARALTKRATKADRRRLQQETATWQRVRGQLKRRMAADLKRQSAAFQANKPLSAQARKLASARPDKKATQAFMRDVEQWKRTQASQRGSLTKSVRKGPSLLKSTTPVLKPDWGVVLAPADGGSDTAETSPPPPATDVDVGIISASEFTLSGGENTGTFATGALLTAATPMVGGNPTLACGVNSDPDAFVFGQANTVIASHWMGTCRKLPAGYRRIVVSVNPRSMYWSSLLAGSSAGAASCITMHVEVLSASRSARVSVLPVEMNIHEQASVGTALDADPMPNAALLALIAVAGGPAAAGVAAGLALGEAFFHGEAIAAWPTPQPSAFVERPARVQMDIEPTGEEVMVRFVLTVQATAGDLTQAICHARLAASDATVMLIP